MCTPMRSGRCCSSTRGAALALLVAALASPSAARAADPTGPVPVPVPVPAHLADGEVGCFGWSPETKSYACANVVAWPGDRCVAIDLIGQGATRAFPVAGGSRCRDDGGPRKTAADVLRAEAVVRAVHALALTRDVPVAIGAAWVVLRRGQGWQLAVRCPDGREALASERLPGDFANRFTLAWADGAAFVAIAGHSHTAMEPGAPVTMVEAGAVDLTAPCRPVP